MKKVELLTMIGKVLEETEVPFEFEDVNGRDVITIGFDDETSPEDLTLTFDEPGSDLTTMNYFSIISVDISPEIMEELIRILPDFNMKIRLGGFGVMADDGVLYFNYSLLLDDIDDETILNSIVACLKVVAGVSVEGKKILLPLLRGKMTAEQLMQGDYQLLI